MFTLSHSHQITSSLPNPCWSLSEVHISELKLDSFKAIRQCQSWLILLAHFWWTLETSYSFLKVRKLVLVLFSRVWFLSIYSWSIHVSSWHMVISCGHFIQEVLQESSGPLYTRNSKTFVQSKPLSPHSFPHSLMIERHIIYISQYETSAPLLSYIASHSLGREYNQLHQND